MYNPKVKILMSGLIFQDFDFQIFLKDGRADPDKLNMNQMAFAFGLLVIGLGSALLMFMFELCSKAIKF